VFQLLEHLLIVHIHLCMYNVAYNKTTMHITAALSLPQSCMDSFELFRNIMDNLVSLSDTYAVTERTTHLVQNYE